MNHNHEWHGRRGTGHYPVRGGGRGGHQGDEPFGSRGYGWDSRNPNMHNIPQMLPGPGQHQYQYLEREQAEGGPRAGDFVGYPRQWEPPGSQWGPLAAQLEPPYSQWQWGPPGAQWEQPGSRGRGVASSVNTERNMQQMHIGEVRREYEQEGTQTPVAVVSENLLQREPRGSRGRGRGRDSNSFKFADRSTELNLMLTSQTNARLRWKDPNTSNWIIPAQKTYNLNPEEYCTTYSPNKKICVNHFPVQITFPKNKIIHQYRVDIERVAKSQPQPQQESSLAESPNPTSTGSGSINNNKRPGPNIEAGSFCSSKKKSKNDLSPDLRKMILMFLYSTLNAKFGKEYGIITDFLDTIYTTAVLESAGKPMELFVAGSAINDCKEERDSEFRVCLIRTSDIHIVDTDLDGLKRCKLIGDAERVYNALLRCVNFGTFTPILKNYLIDYSNPHNLYGGIVSYSGYHVQLPFGLGLRRFINIDLANMVTYMNKPIPEVLRSLFDADRNTENPTCNANPDDVRTWEKDDFSKANDFLGGCQILYSRSNGNLRTDEPTKWLSTNIIDICAKSVSEHPFEHDGKSKIMYWEYYFEKYGKKLCNRHGPLLVCKGRSRFVIPAEICMLKSRQSFNKNLTDAQTRKLSEKAQLTPKNYYLSICEGMKHLGLRNNDLVNLYGLKLENNGDMLSIAAKVLAPPQICYGKRIPNTSVKTDSSIMEFQSQSYKNERCTLVPKDGAWDIWNTENQFEFYDGEDINDWGILNLAASKRTRPHVFEKQAREFAKQLKEKALLKNIKLNDISMYREDNRVELGKNVEAGDANVQSLCKILEEFKNKLKNQKPCFVLVILPFNGQLYNHVKQAAELSVGILTQCIIGASIMEPKRLDSTLGNILLKITSKLNQVNHVVMAPSNLPNSFSVFNDPVLIIGADVSHPPAGSSKSIEKDQHGNIVNGQPSFAAITSNTDRTVMSYMMHMQAQERAGLGAAEVITGLDEVIFKFLENFRSKTSSIPVKIIYYRDGVGDGQFQEVLRTEMAAIRKACIRFGDKYSDASKDYQPPITFVIVQKRHKTRFFMKVPKTDLVENAHPGTVVDKEIVNPHETDFYLLSHGGVRERTSRPTRYHVLWDDSDFSMNEIQILTYFLCYMFVRCTRSVKIPAPTYYSHWAAKRAEILSKGWGDKLTVDELNQKLAKSQSEVVQEFRDCYPMHFV